MKQNGSRTQIYDAADLWIDVALRHDDSLFTPGQAIWSPTVLADLYERFVENPDESHEKSFEQKFEEQLSGAAPETFQLAGELLFIHFLVADDMSGDHKRTVIARVLGWSPEPVAIPEKLGLALEYGIAATGVAFRTIGPSSSRSCSTRCATGRPSTP